MKVLVTGGTGYIASHTVILLLEAKHEPIIIDNFSNSSPDVLKRIETISGVKVECHDVDLENQKAVDKVFAKHVNLNTGKCEIEAVIHFAARKCVPESIKMPLDYYHTNILATLNVLQALCDFGVCSLIFSSSAAIYGSGKEGYFSEDSPLNPTNPYAVSKVACEKIIEDCARAYNLKAISLRYFNPIGAHPSGLLGENPQALNNFFPILAHCAFHNQPLVVHGFDYPTADGTTIRDYLHVMDVADGHLKALQYMQNQQQSHLYDDFNLGTGRGTSVLEALKTFTNTTGANISFRFGPRRLGDVPILVAKVEKAEQVLNWKPTYTLKNACKDLWKWQQHPH